VDEREKVRNNIVNCAYPQIMEQLRENVEQCVQQSYDAVITNIENEFAQKTEQLTSEMKNMQDRRKEEKEKYDSYIEKLKEDIAEIDKLISELE
jgi:Skp family chaperone for outer membrane proteins